MERSWRPLGALLGRSWSSLGYPNGSHLVTLLGSVFGILFETLLEFFLNNFGSIWGIILGVFGVFEGDSGRKIGVNFWEKTPPK